MGNVELERPQMRDYLSEGGGRVGARARQG